MPGSPIPPPDQTMTLGPVDQRVTARLDAWEAAGTISAVWGKDHSVWVDDPAPEITDRLGWLDLASTMQPHLGEIAGFAADIRAEGIRHVVLLGMGGSSLAPEVFARTFAPVAGHPDLIVLDSTHPAAIAAVRATIDPARTLFLVSSKSGTTIEPLSFFRLFWSVVAASTDHPGRRFAAITDPGSHLADVARQRGFRAVFTALPDVGGRYSALTHFGLVPAALVGADVAGLLGSAARLQAVSGPDVDPHDSPGVVLGAALGELALAGRDKATFVVSPSLAAFPAWIEQLIAESTGKDGIGIIPVADEPLGPPEVYGDDRVFVHISLRGDETASQDAALAELETAGHPVVRIVCPALTDLGREMYRAEWATAMAGSVLGIHPFDQPDVQRAKQLAAAAVAGELEASAIPETPADERRALGAAIAGLLATVTSNDYVALQAFIEPSPGNATALMAARVAIRDRLHVATTLGFGPRFLHSTGQLHKGGPNTGVFLQIVDHPELDLPVPETEFTFARLVAGQADGDFQALRDAGRRVLRVCLGSDPAGGLAALTEALCG